MTYDDLNAQLQHLNDEENNLLKQLQNLRSQRTTLIGTDICGHGLKNRYQKPQVGKRFGIEFVDHNKPLLHGCKCCDCENK